jgi:hypothetical protein
MYCGAALPPVEGRGAPAEGADVDPQRARELLAGLSPQARALMPADVLQRLEAQANPVAAAQADKPAASKPPVVASVQRRRSSLGGSGIGLAPGIGLGRRPTTREAIAAVGDPAPPAADTVKSAPAPAPEEPLQARPVAPSSESGPGPSRGSAPAADMPASPAARPGDRAAALVDREPSTPLPRPRDDHRAEDAATAPGADAPEGDEAEEAGAAGLPEATTLDRMRKVDLPPDPEAPAVEFLDESDEDLPALETGEFFQPLSHTEELELQAGLGVPGSDGFVSVYDLEPITDDLDGFDSASELAPRQIAPPSDTLSTVGPLTHALARGAGPFGPRGAAFRLILEPDVAYKGNAHWLRHRLASTLGVDLYTAVQALQRDTPSFLAASDTEAEAEEQRAHLLEAGLKCHVIRGGSWLEGTEPIAVVRVEGDPPGLVHFTTHDGLVLECKRRGFWWAAIAEIEPDSGPRERAERERRERRKLDVETGPYLVLDLFLSRQRRPLRLRSDRFDFSCLGNQRSLSSAVNLRRLLIWLAHDPSVPIALDEGFKRVPSIEGVDRGELGERLPRREIDFTEYALLRDLLRRSPSP